MKMKIKLSKRTILAGPPYRADDNAAESGSALERPAKRIKLESCKTEELAKLSQQHLAAIQIHFGNNAPRVKSLSRCQPLFDLIQEGIAAEQYLRLDCLGRQSLHFQQKPKPVLPRAGNVSWCLS